jgi:hypothetical protein
MCHCMLYCLQYECEDILGDALLFEALGVGLGKAEMVNVALAVKKLGEDPHKGVGTVCVCVCVLYWGGGDTGGLWRGRCRCFEWMLARQRTCVLWVVWRLSARTRAWPNAGVGP